MPRRLHFIVKKVRIKLCNFRINRVSRVSSLDIYQLILALDDPNVQPRNIPQNAEEILADMAIGSPAICIYRIFRRLSNDDKQTRQYAEEVAREIASLFNSRTGLNNSYHLRLVPLFYKNRTAG